MYLNLNLTEAHFSLLSGHDDHPVAPWVIKQLHEVLAPCKDISACMCPCADCSCTTEGTCALRARHHSRRHPDSVTNSAQSSDLSTLVLTIKTFMCSGTPCKPDTAHRAQALRAVLETSCQRSYRIHSTLCAWLLEIRQLSWRPLAPVRDQGSSKKQSIPVVWLCHPCSTRGSRHNMTAQHSKMRCLMECTQF